MTGTRLHNRAVLRISPTDKNEDVRAFLQGLVTSDVTAALPAYAGLLTPQGKALFDFIIWPENGDNILIDCEAQSAEALAKRLSLYRLRRKISIELAPDMAVHWSLETQGLTPQCPGVPDPRLAQLGHRWIAQASGDNGEAGADDRWRAHRLSQGVPEGSDELGDILWLETNAAELNGVSFEKGCYIGQENTARMNWRQKVNRRLVVVPVEQSNEKRRKIIYPELKLAVDHLRVADIADADPAFAPDWMHLDPSE